MASEHPTKRTPDKRMRSGMIHGKPSRRKLKRWSLAYGGLTVVWATACAPRATPPVTITNEAFGPMTIAVAPALNYSGATDFDANAVADLMASELSYVEGVNVIPVSRVMAVLARQGRQEVGSPSEALSVAEALGADAILVFAVTEYDPYNPPIVGIAAQLYGFRRAGSLGGLDPVLASRQARPFETSRRVPGTVPLVQAERVFDAGRPDVVRGVKRFAALRRGEKGPWGWRRYMASQRHYLRYCCHALLETMASGSGAKVAVGSGR